MNTQVLLCALLMIVMVMVVRTATTLKPLPQIVHGCIIHSAYCTILTIYKKYLTGMPQQSKVVIKFKRQDVVCLKKSLSNPNGMHTDLPKSIYNLILSLILKVQL